MKRSEKIVTVSLLSTLGFSLIGYWDTIDYWVVDILSQFRFQYLLVSIAMLLYSVWIRRKLLTLLSLFLIFINLIGIDIFGKNIQAMEHNNAPFKIYSANIYRKNENLDRLLHELSRQDAEVVVLVEVTPQHYRTLMPVIKRYPYRAEYTPVGHWNVGILLLSKFPILDHDFKQLSDEGNAMVRVVLDINQQKVTFFALHSPSPLHINEFWIRQRHLLWLAETIANTRSPVIVAGDFNATPFSPIFKKLLSISGLEDSCNGFGWQPSWPVYLPFLGLPIDHILVTPDIHVHKRTIGPTIGSDHYPIVAEVSL